MAHRGGLAGTPSPAELWLPSSRSSTPSPNGCHPPVPVGHCQQRVPTAPGFGELLLPRGERQDWSVLCGLHSLIVLKGPM